MNKNVKRIVALTLAFGTVSAVAPATNTNLLLTKAYATDDDDNTDETLDELKLKTSSGSDIKLYSDDDYDEKIDSEDVSDDGKYYAKTTSKKIQVNPEGVSSKYVRVFKGKSSSTKGKSASTDIDLSSGSNVIIVRVYKNKPDTDIKYSEDDDVASEYTLHVKYTGSDSGSTTDDDSSYDDIYLDELTVGSQEITLDHSKVAYDYNVANNVSQVTIKAKPDDEDADNEYDVKINGTDVTDDDYKKTVSLAVGVNEIKIELDYEDDDDDNYERDYTLKINRAAPAQVAPVVTKKADQWVQVNGKWQYNDSQGNPTKNSWFFDRNYGKWYFLDENGNMKTGWVLVAGQYYFLYDNGAMATSTTINGYKVNASGAWIR